MSEPSSKKDVDELKQMQAQQAAAQAGSFLAQQSNRFGDSYQFPAGGGASVEDLRRAQRDDEDTLGMLRRKYGLG